MGAEPWSCFVPYQEDVVAALESARAQEFAAGRYRMIDPDNPPATIEEACVESAESGTASVLDMIGVADAPLGDVANFMDSGAIPESFCMVAPLSAAQLIELYGTEKPSREQVDSNDEYYEWIDRGLGVYVIVYDGETPSEIFFAGYSFD
jgi:hypothetical protein